MKVYVQGTKKGLNEALAAGQNPEGTEYNMFNPNGYMTRHAIRDLDDGTILAFFTKYSPDGQPIARSWGTKAGNKIK